MTALDAYISPMGVAVEPAVLGRLRFVLRGAGGAGSGNFGHSGRPGHVGGSGLPNVGGILSAIERADGGFTYRVQSGRQPHTGYMVSLHKDREKVLDVRSVTGVALAEYVRDNRDLIRKPGNYLGVWHNPDDSKVYLDVSTRVMNPMAAYRSGQRAGQLAYFDLKQGKSVRIDQTKSRAAALSDGRRLGAVDRTVDGYSADAGGNQEDAIDLRDAGGPGSGNFGHEGRPGEVGGSSGDVGRRDVLPAKSTRPTPNAVVHADADAYNTSIGRDPIDHSQYLQVDIAHAREIASAYDALPVDDSSNPDVIAAYQSLVAETSAQYAWATDHGMHFEPWTKDGQPYASSREMAQDVAENRHLSFYTGGEPHPFLSVVDPKTGLTANDEFRAIHDYYGHTAGGYSFGPRGEENAWAAHVQMFSPLAARAMTTETRGQNSKVNFGVQNYNADGSYKNIPPADRPYAIQKVALLPERFWTLRTMGGVGSENFGHATAHRETAIHAAADAQTAKLQALVQVAFKRAWAALDVSRARSATTVSGAEQIASQVAGVLEATVKKLFPPALERTAVAGGEAGTEILRKRLRTAGDVEGHPFHGNQWTSMGGASISVALDAVRSPKFDKAVKFVEKEYPELLGPHIGIQIVAKGSREVRGAKTHGTTFRNIKVENGKPVRNATGEIQYSGKYSITISDRRATAQDYVKTLVHELQHVKEYEAYGKTSENDVRSVSSIAARKFAGLSHDPEWRTAKKPPIAQIALQFDGKNPAAQAWAKKHSGELAKDLSDTTRQRVRDAIVNLFETGDQTQLEEDLFDAVGDVDRAAMIGRNEAMIAVHEGQRMAWGQAVDKGLLTGNEQRTWIATEGYACPICEELDGEMADMDGEYPEPGGDGPPQHPNCRCTENLSY